MAELKPGINPVTITDNKAIDPDGIWLPQGPEADKEAAADWTPQGLTDKSDQVNITKDYDPSDKFSVKDDEYMNKEPNKKLKEGGNEYSEAAKRVKDFVDNGGWEPDAACDEIADELGLDSDKLWEYYNRLNLRGSVEKLWDLTMKEEILGKHSLKSDSWDRKEIGAPGDSEFYVEYTFDLDGLEALAADLGVDVEDIKKHALPTDGFDDDVLESQGLPLGDENGDGRYEEFVFDEDDLRPYSESKVRKMKEGFDMLDDLLSELTSGPDGMSFEDAATYIIETNDGELNDEEISYLKRKSGYEDGDEGMTIEQAVELVAEMEADDMDRDEAILYVAETNDIDQGELEDAIYGNRFNESGGPAFEGDMEQPVPTAPGTASAINPAAPDSTDAVDTSGEVELPEYLQYDSEEDLEFSNGLDSITHSHQSPNEHNEFNESAHTRHSKDKLLVERFERAVLQEARGEKGQLMHDYLDQAQNPSFEDFVRYAQQLGIEDIPNKYYFNTLLKKTWGSFWI